MEKKVERYKNVYYRQRRGRWEVVTTWVEDDKQRTKRHMTDVECDPDDPRVGSKLAKKAGKEWIERMREEDAEAERRAAAEAERARHPGRYVTVPEYVDRFIDNLEASGRIEPSTVWDYRRGARHIAKGFDGVLLADLTREMGEQWIVRMRDEGVGRYAAKKARNLLKRVCNDAEERGDLDKNPMRGVKADKLAKPRPNALDEEGVARLNGILDQWPDERVADAVRLALHTGMRRGEICALRWRDVKAGRQVLKVERAVGRGADGYYLKPTKTDGSTREIPYRATVGAVLDRCRARQEQERLKAESETKAAVPFSDDWYVLGYTDGRYLGPDKLTEGFQALADEYGLKGTQGRRPTFHDLRHTYATHALVLADPEAVAGMLGHSDTSVTLNIYGDSLRSSKERLADMTDEAMSATADPVVMRYPTERKAGNE